LKQHPPSTTCSNIPGNLVLNRDQVDLVAISVGDCSQRRHPGQVERTDERGKTVSAMYAPACHNLLQ
jgi:hypothetical protein